MLYNEMGWRLAQLKIIVTILFFLVFPRASHSLVSDNDVPPLLVVIFGGFRWDYLSRTLTENFDEFREAGVFSPRGIKPVFPTSTTPNHWSLLTGLYAESHGFLDDEYYDPNLNKTVKPLHNHKGKVQPDKDQVEDVLIQTYNGVETIWVTVERRGGSAGTVACVAGSLPGGGAPGHHVTYSGDTDDKVKVDQAIEWLSGEGEVAVDLALVYVARLELAAQKWGPDSHRMKTSITESDALMGYLMDEMYMKGLEDRVNVIVLGDHGMAATSNDKVVHLYLPAALCVAVGGSPVLGVYPNSGQESRVYRLIQQALSKGGAKVYKKDDLPERLHIQHSSKTAPLVVIADLGYTLIVGEEGNVTTAGSSGYDNKYDVMNPFFMARGPSFRQNVSVDSFSMVDLYPLMCHLLAVTPRPNNGSLEAVSGLLHVLQLQKPGSSSVYVVLLVLGVAMCLFVLLCRRRRYRRYWYKQLTPASWQTEGVVTIAWPVPNLSTRRSLQNAHQMPLLADLPESEDEF